MARSVADFEAALTAYRAAHPAAATCEVYLSDLNGVARGKLVPLDMLGKLGQGGMRMPISTLGLDIFGADVAENRIALETGDPDGVLLPVAASLAPVLWAREPRAQLQCMMTDETGSALCPYDPRAVLAGVAARAAAAGLTPVVALELEFYLVDPEQPCPPRNPAAGGRLARAQLYDMDVMASFEPVIAGIAQAARALGAPTEAAICEFGEGQFEMNLAHEPDALAAADHMIALKRAVRGVARKHGLDASFMPKPYGESAGSGMHIHVSLLDAKGRNIFDAGEGGDPNAALRHGLAGLKRSMAEAMLVFAPHMNSYRRFMPGTYAPMVAAWGLDNRGTALRVPAVAGGGARIEHRVAGSDANPYLLVAAVLAGILDGLERPEEPGPPARAEAGQGEGPALPLSWAMAEQAFAASGFVAEWLGPEFRRVYAGIKRQERATLMARIPDVEYDAYLRTV